MLMRHWNKSVKRRVWEFSHEWSEKEIGKATFRFIRGQSKIIQMIEKIAINMRDVKWTDLLLAANR